MLLLAATALLLFANGRWGIAVVAWIAPALLVRFVRTQPFGVAFGGGLAALSIANYVWWRGIFPLPTVAFIVASIVLGFATLVPYLLDRRFAPRLGGLLGTLVLPAATVTIEMLNSKFSPYGSWGSMAYSQSGNLPLLQVLSFTGLAGVTFLLLWFAAAVNQSPRSAIVCVVVTAIVVFAGSLRLVLAGATESVNIAAITPRIPTYTVRGDAANRAVYDVLSGIRRGRNANAAQWEALRTRAAGINNGLLAASDQAIGDGAKIVLWSEGAGIVERADEDVLISQAADLARRRAAWIGLSFLTVDRRGGRTFENKSVLLEPSGAAAWIYRKAHPVPGMEACVPGDGRVPLATTPFGRVATVICYDADFPRLIRQAGVGGAEILLIPADDWPEIATTHSRMAAFRAIEQGLSIVRATSNGFSTVVDRYGRVRARSDYFSGVRTLRADVPRNGARTIYARIGDLAGWSCVALLLVLLIVATVSKRERGVYHASVSAHQRE
jgi:apolipoprotein N-acyltransferase